jgi:acetyltransferase-like isoleucine patch superfamily enzyme
MLGFRRVVWGASGIILIEFCGLVDGSCASVTARGAEGGCVIQRKKINGLANETDSAPAMSGGAYTARGFAKQIYLRFTRERPASRLSKFLMSWRFSCLVSPHAHVYEPRRIRLSRDVMIEDRALLNFRSQGSPHEITLSIGEGTRIMPDARLLPQNGFIRIGKQCSVQHGTLLYGQGGLEIGDDTRIAAYCVMSPMNHVFKDPEKPIRLQGETAKGIRIGRDVWLGNGVRVLDGVEIGDGCVIGAGSVVTRSIPPYSVAVGVPARVIGQRK